METQKQKNRLFKGQWGMCVSAHTYGHVYMCVGGVGGYGAWSVISQQNQVFKTTQTQHSNNTVSTRNLVPKFNSSITLRKHTKDEALPCKIKCLIKINYL